MSKIDENEIRRRLKLLSQIEPTPEAARRATERVRDTLVNKEKRRESTGIWRAIIKRPIAKLAAAAMAMITICVALYFTITLNQPSNVTTNTRESKTGSSKPTAMMRPVLRPPGPGEVCLDKNLDGEKMNRRIPQDGWIQIGKGLFWYYTGGTYLAFKVEEPLIYLSIDEGPYELAGVRLQTPNDLESLNAVLQEYSPGSLTIWCHIQPPYELAELPYLEKIISFQQIDPNVLSDLALLSYLTNLEAVHIKNRHQPCLQVVDVSPLSNLNELKVLTLYGFHNLSSISDMGMNLTYLDLTGAINLKDLTPLAKLTKLECLKLHSCYRITDISPLADLANLTSLELFGCQFTDLSPIENLTSLTFLGLCGSVVSDFSAIETLTNLEYLDLGACQNLSDLSPLATLENLKDLNLWACHRLTDLWPLAELTSLEFLNLRACDNITDLSPLAALTKLKKLDLLGCTQVADISPLQNLTNLNRLNISLCPNISDLSPLQTIITRGAIISVPPHLKEQLSELRSAGLMREN